MLWAGAIHRNRRARSDKKADLVIWCVLREPAVVLAGWSLPDDVRNAPVRVTGPLYRRIENHQLDTPDLREMHELQKRLSVGTRP